MKKTLSSLLVILLASLCLASCASSAVATKIGARKADKTAYEKVIKNTPINVKGASSSFQKELRSYLKDNGFTVIPEGIAQKTSEVTSYINKLFGRDVKVTYHLDVQECEYNSATDKVSKFKGVLVNMATGEQKFEYESSVPIKSKRLAKKIAKRLEKVVD